ncbi:LrgB family protein [Bdellovibrio svalbardensis]|uniref:LrgB family protein n=1 Tax=Bdellovibrio svalbardensis TaxID=2972972 RepID=A0ABT6DGC5_9BACT|nr:LrgB family protein [Bdellovibrio svalbardensis]MDG0815300.1 LrgB family protein [Bdellovibrio svalbardensis]
MIEIFSLILTLGVYLASRKASTKLNNHPLLSPAVLSILIISAILLIFKIPYREYFQGARPIHFMLGPATVSLALPLFAQLEKLKKLLVPLCLSLIVGSVIGIFSAVLIGASFGLPHEILLSLAPKSVTTPIAMGVSEKIGGIASLSTVFVMITGLFGAAIATSILGMVKVKDPAVKGFALGLASHGLGTARAFQVSSVAGAFAGLAMALNGLMTAILVPLLLFLIP